jgi:hypothetical protein
MDIAFTCVRLLFFPKICSSSISSLPPSVEVEQQGILELLVHSAIVLKLIKRKFEIDG